MKEVNKLQRTIPYFTHAHTSKGYVQTLRSNVADLERVIALHHPSPVVMTALFHELIDLFEKEEIEIIHSTQNVSWIEGVIIRADSIAYVRDSALTGEHEADVHIDLRPFFPSEKKTEANNHAKEGSDEIYQAAYRHFQQSLQIHQQLERIYTKEMNFSAADSLANSLIEELFPTDGSKRKKRRVYERFFGTITSNGLIHFVAELIEPIETRIFLKGRAGTGKSTFMNNVLRTALQKNYQCEKYRCSFDPDSVDMIIIRELNCCIFDSSPPHEFFPSRKNDRIIDLYEKTVNPTIETLYKKEIATYQNLYKNEMEKGMSKLKEAEQISENMTEDVEVSDIRMKEIVEMIVVSNF